MSHAYLLYNSIDVDKVGASVSMRENSSGRHCYREMNILIIMKRIRNKLTVCTSLIGTIAERIVEKNISFDSSSLSSKYTVSFTQIAVLSS